MDRETARIFRVRLRGIRARLRDDVTQLAFAPDCGMTMQLWTQKEEMLRKIEAALELIENGTYGRCQRCGRRILALRGRLQEAQVLAPSELPDDVERVKSLWVELKSLADVAGGASARKGVPQRGGGRYRAD